jgi:hypothetical protein
VTISAVWVSSETLYDLTPARKLAAALYSQTWRAALTIELLKHALNGAGATAAAHSDVELVVVFGHCVVCMCDICTCVGRERGRCSSSAGQKAI